MRVTTTLLFSLAVLFYASQSWAVGVLTPAAGDATFMVAERAIESGTAVMVNGNTVFTVAGGPIQIVDLVSICVTANDATASTLQWQSVPTVGTATTLSGASASLASATAGTTVRLAPTALSTAPVIVAAAAGGVQLGTNVANSIDIKDGTIKLVIGVGSTTGTWRHVLRYKPLSPSATVLP
jgi:hypothetical protein